MIYLIDDSRTNTSDTFQLVSVDYCLDYFKDKDEIGLDIETIGYDPHTGHILSIQLGDYENQFVVNCLTTNIQLFKELLETKTFILQNAKFDLRFFLKHHIVINNVYDTYLAECLINLGLDSVRKALDVLAKRYLNVDLDKSIRGTIHKEGLSDKVIKYGADDVKYLAKIKQAQEIELEKKDLFRAMNLENKFVIVLAYTEFCGMYLNSEKWIERTKKDEIKQNEVRESLNKYILDNNLNAFIDQQLSLFDDVHPTINWDSPKQVIKLFNSLGIETKTRDKKTGELKDSCEESVLVPQESKFPILTPYLEYKGLAKRISTYGDNFISQINKVTGRLHTQYKQLLSTGRLSSGGKDGKIEYINFQNIPRDKDIRECFQAQEGNTLIDADFSGQEQVVLANWSLDKNLLKFYNEGMSDMHSYVASLIYPELRGLTVKEIKDNYSNLRYNAKTAGFAINYGGNGDTIARNIGESKEVGDDVYNKYMSAFPGLKKYFDECKKIALNRGYVLHNSLTGHKSFIEYFDEFKELEKEFTREFWDSYRYNKENDTSYFHSELLPKVRNYFRRKGSIERMAQNYPIQGSSASITKLAAYYFYKKIQKKGLLFIVLLSNQIHDELLVECPKDISKEVAEDLVSCMEYAGSIFCKTIKLKADYKITDKWEH